MGKTYKTVLVTGGAGFIGSHVVDAFIRRRAKVFVVDDLSNGKRANLNPNAEFIKISITSPKFIELVKKLKPDLIVHAAAQQDVRKSVADPKHDATVNILGTLNVIEAGVQAKVKKFVFTSTGGAIYPAQGKPPFSESVPPQPLSPYGIAKLACENYFHFQYVVHGIPYTILRFANVYGPRQDCTVLGGVIAIFADKMAKGEGVVINGDGKQTRDYVYISDVVNAVMLASTRKFVGIVNIGTGKQMSVNMIFRMLRKAMGVDMPERHVPGKSGEVAKSALDVRNAAKKLGWVPKVKFEEGLKKTVKWYQSNPKHATCK